MGTNYYVKTGEKFVKNGWLTEEIYHIGKSSYGWYFALHVIPWAGLNSFEDWKEYLKGKTIHDEYGRKVSYSRMIKTILRDSKDESWGKQSNYEEGLVVSDDGDYKTCVGKYGLHYCIGRDACLDRVNGDGCYTLVEGDFE